MTIDNAEQAHKAGTAPEDAPVLDDEANRLIDRLSSAFDVGLVALLRQVIKGQLAVADAETAIARVRQAVAESRDNAQAGREKLQLTLIDLVEAEMTEQMAGLRALVGAHDREQVIKLRMNHLRDTMIRQSSAIGRYQDAQAEAFGDAWEPILNLVREWRVGAPIGSGATVDADASPVDESGTGPNSTGPNA